MGMLIDNFGKKTFNEDVMLRHLPKEVFKKLKKTIREGDPLDKDIALVVAHGMKEWALENKVTHFTHWFHPMRGSTAEKHDTFLHKKDSCSFIERFSEKELIQGEADASSFPSGGVRSTFEARGYTAWDPTSPAFIIDDTLCIPSVYFSYDGDALDKKTPLIKSADLVEKEALRLLKLFGNRTAKYTNSTIGAEQEFFLVDEKYVKLRPDLLFTGRTLIGSPSPKEQQLEDHYFGSINERVLTFMKDLENSLFELGIPVKTRHNEVAQNQFEFAPIFENANIASDHNALALEVLHKTAKRHNLSILFHEKPFKGINGSGKHINWSLEDSDGKNLLSPGKSPKLKKQFLAFLISSILGVAKYEKILKYSALTYSNEFRLGGNEAPPSIISVFTGEKITAIFDTIEKSQDLTELPEKFISIGLSKIPQIKADHTDRNRTSPFAFTGNKFEFRMPGSSFSVSENTTVINSIMYHGIKEFCDILENELKKDKYFDHALLLTIKETYKKAKKVIFNGDCYSKEWQKEAIKRKLSTENTLFSLTDVITEKEFENCFVKPKIFSKSYLNALIEIKKDLYLKNMEIDGNVLMEMLNTNIIHSFINQLEVYNNHDIRLKTILKTTSNLNTKKYAEKLQELLSKKNDFENDFSIFKPKSIQEKMKMSKSMIGKMNLIRELVDYLEARTANNLWNYPRYSQILVDL